MTLTTKAGASKNRYCDDNVMNAKIRTHAVQLFLFISLAVVSAVAQLPASGPAPVPDRQSPPLITPQPPSAGAFNGSGTVDKLVPGVIQITLLDAIDRGIKHNLGLLLSQQQSAFARAQYRSQLSALLPNVSGNVSDSINQINLAAFGIPLPAGLTSPVVGPFGIFDAHANMAETLWDFNAINKVHAASQNEKAAKFDVQDARELVVLVVGNEYLLTIASAARLDTAKAQFNTAQTIFRQSQDLKAAGVNAGIDVLRAQVQMQTQQQRVLAAQNQYEQQKMVFARTIGIPVSQQFQLTDNVPYAQLPPLNLDEAIAQAYKQRPEFLAAEARTRASELTVKAARGESLPSLELNGQAGYIGPSPGSAEFTYNLTAGVRIPVFQGGRVRADVDQAESQLRQNRLQLEDLRSRVEMEVRSAWLDVKTSDDQVAVSRQQVDLAGQQLKESQDRYAAGVSGSLEVVQSQ